MIQAMGRVGRNKLQQDYSIRYRDDNIIKKLFIKSFMAHSFHKAIIRYFFILNLTFCFIITGLAITLYYI